MDSKRILVIPHVGSAYGHLIRIGEVLGARYRQAQCVYVAIPKTVSSAAASHLPPNVNLLTYDSRPTVTSKTGRFDFQGFLDLFEIDKAFYQVVRPDLIVGDPGIRAAVLGERTKTPWQAIMHGCYLPIPTRLISKQFSDINLRNIATLAWDLVEEHIDRLLSLVPQGRLPVWRELCRRGQVLVPNSSYAEPCENATHLGRKLQKIGFGHGIPFRCVITVCSSGESVIPKDVLIKLAEIYGEVAVIGPTEQRPVDGVYYMGSTIDVATVVGPETTVFCHGGHGTLRSVGHARRVIIAPGDVDQLCNALIAHAYLGMELALGGTWLQRLRASNPFQRRVDWDGLRKRIEEISNEAPINSYSTSFDTTVTGLHA